MTVVVGFAVVDVVDVVVVGLIVVVLVVEVLVDELVVDVDVDVVLDEVELVLEVVDVVDVVDVVEVLAGTACACAAMPPPRKTATPVAAKSVAPTQWRHRA